MENEHNALTPDSAAARLSERPSIENIKTRLRIRFTKCDDLRWISHRDLARVWERLLRRAGLQLAFSQGFHPKPRINFPSALALGIEALDEVVELEVLGAFEIGAIEQDICREMPPGMRLLKIESPPYSLGKAKVLGASYRIAHGLPPDVALSSQPQWAGQLAPACGGVQSVEKLTQRLREVQSSEQVEILREDKTIVCPTNDPYFDLRIEGDFLVFSLPNQTQGSIRPSELLELVGLGHLLAQGETLQRTVVHLLEPSPSASDPVTA